MLGIELHLMCMWKKNGGVGALTPKVGHPPFLIPRSAVFQKAGRTREKPDGKQNPAERR